MTYTANVNTGLSENLPVGFINGVAVTYTSYDEGLGGDISLGYLDFDIDVRSSVHTTAINDDRNNLRPVCQ